jgi:uncharacterized membrane protein YsdA (DUF1294 family)
MNIPLPFLYGIIYTGLNVLVFATFGYDKRKARMNSWRTPENVLLILAALGPFGALIAMVGFRHKTRHVKFFLVPVFALLHVALFLLVWPWLS